MDTHTDISKITPQALYQKISNEEHFVFIDTLNNDHFEKVHIPGAKNACVFEVVFLDNVEKMISDRKEEIIVYGSSSKSLDAVTAARKLVRADYPNVSALEGGLARWREEGYPLEGEGIETSDTSEPEPRIGDGTYRVGIDTSVIEWTGRNPNKKHYGTVQLTGGAMTVKDGVMIDGAFEVDMTSLKNIDLEGDDLQPVLISHLKSDDFFFVKMFPRASFGIVAAIPVQEPTSSSPNLEVKGTLELRGIKKEVEFPATLNLLSEDKITVEAHFDIDRTRWGIIYGSSRFFEYLGMHLVFDVISIQLRLMLERNEPGR